MIAAVESAAAGTLPREAVNAKLVSLISTGAVALGILLSGFVIREPAPYEIYMAGLIAVWALFGLRMQVATQQLANTSQLKKTKRKIARLRTIMKEKAAK